MSYADYIQASKLGKKDYQSKLMEGKSPTLEVLDDILHTTKDYREVSLGLVEIPLDQIVGTKTAARSSSNASIASIQVLSYMISRYIVIRTNIIYHTFLIIPYLR